MRLLCLQLLLSTSVAIAACPRDTGIALPSGEELRALEIELAGLAAECGRDAGFLAYRGAVLNALGRPQDAAPLLEQALLLDPELAGAQLDYAESLAALGDTAAAVSLIRDLLARPDVPAPLRAHLSRRLSALDALQRFDLLTGLRVLIGQDWEGAVSVATKVGYDSNLNSAPSRDVLNLTIPGGEAVLLLADRFRARGGAAGLGEVRGQLARRLDGGAALQFFGEVRGRTSPSASDTNYLQGQGVAAWSYPLRSGDALFSAGYTRLQYGGDHLYSATRFAVSRDWRRDGCQPRLGVEAELRRYPVASELDGRFTALAGGAGCVLGSNRVTVAARLGVDAARRDRPGGDQRVADLRLAWIGAVGSGTLAADLVISHQRDEHGFSPLLENNAARRLHRASLHLEYAYPLTRDWSLLASFDGTLQRSNLPLFDVSGRAFYLGLRWLTSR